MELEPRPGALSKREVCRVEAVFHAVFFVVIRGGAEFQEVSDPGVALAAHVKGVELIEAGREFVLYDQDRFITGQAIISYEQSVIGYG